MGQLIDDLLLLSRVTRREMVREKVELSALARDVLADLREAEPERAVDAAVADGLVANGDPALLRIVLQNLLAVSYTHLRAHETRHDLVCRLLLEKKKKKK